MQNFKPGWQQIRAWDLSSKVAAEYASFASLSGRAANVGALASFTTGRSGWT